MLERIADILLWAMIAVFIVNLLQRRHQRRGEKKRFATLYIGILLFFLYLSVLTINEFSLPPWLLIVCSILGIGVAVYFREHLFPFRLRCKETGTRLSIQEILFDDSNTHTESEEPPESS